MIPLIDTVTIGNYIEVNNTDGADVFHLSADKLNIRYGPTVGNAIVTAKNVWKPIETQKPLLTRYVLCNGMSVSFKFEQQAPSSVYTYPIELEPNDCYYYAFLSPKGPQRLSISVQSEDNWISCPLPLNDDDKLKTLPIDDNKILLVTTKKLSTTQKQIIVKGQIEIMNMTNEPFRVQYVDQQPVKECDATPPNVISLCANGNGSFFEACNDESEPAHIRLQLATELGCGWSGKVPLSEPTTAGPWLVKVPHKSEQRFVAYSIRIHCELIEMESDVRAVNGERPMRVLAVIWPMFLIRSLMPMDLCIDDKECQRSYTVKGQANCTDLPIAGTFNTEHPFVLHYGFVSISIRTPSRLFGIIFHLII